MRLVTNSTAMQRVAELIDRVATTGSNVLILGESGTGKDAAARMIHDRSNRKDRPFVKIDCAALPEELLESELFGMRKAPSLAPPNRSRDALRLPMEVRWFSMRSPA